MKSFSPSRSNLCSSWISGVVTLILIQIQLLLVSVNVYSSCVVSRHETGTKPRDAACESWTNHFGPATLSLRGIPAPSLGNWLAKIGSSSLESTVRQVIVDIDHDGDPDLIALTNLPRLLIWLNDGRGRFTSWHTSSSLHPSHVFEDAADSNSEDTPLFCLWLGTQPLSLQLIRVAATRFDPKSGFLLFTCICQSSPRAPPSQVS
jgi:hypothetical protein